MKGFCVWNDAFLSSFEYFYQHKGSNALKSFHMSSYDDDFYKLLWKKEKQFLYTYSNHCACCWCRCYFYLQTHRHTCNNDREHDARWNQNDKGDCKYRSLSVISCFVCLFCVFVYVCVYFCVISLFLHWWLDM